jgi:hypothetical protein
MQYMPQLYAAIKQVAILVAVNRAFWIVDDDAMLSRMNRETNVAASRYKAAQNAFSAEVRARKFGPDGLSRGMPFVWNVLGPNWAPYWSAV